LNDGVSTGADCVLDCRSTKCGIKRKVHPVARRTFVAVLGVLSRGALKHPDVRRATVCVRNARSADVRENRYTGTLMSAS
jgi:hypothetical protein